LQYQYHYLDRILDTTFLIRLSNAEAESIIDLNLEIPSVIVYGSSLVACVAVGDNMVVDEAVEDRILVTVDKVFTYEEAIVVLDRILVVVGGGGSMVPLCWLIISVQT
jgi:hypothetical protein